MTKTDEANSSSSSSENTGGGFFGPFWSERNNVEVTILVSILIVFALSSVLYCYYRFFRVGRYLNTVRKDLSGSTIAVADAQELQHQQYVNESSVYIIGSDGDTEDDDSNHKQNEFSTIELQNRGT